MTAQPPTPLRRLVLVLGDQLWLGNPALAGLDPAQDAVLMIEAPGEAPSDGTAASTATDEATTPADDPAADEAATTVGDTDANGGSSAGEAETDEATSGGAPSGGLPILPLVAIAAGLVGLATIVVVLRRNARPSSVESTTSGRRDRRSTRPIRGTDGDPAETDPTPAIAELLDATRRMTNALDDDAVAQIAVSEGVRVTRAEQGAFARRTADGLELMVETHAGLTNPDRLWSGALRRVVETGQPAVAVVHDEPALARLPLSMLAVPVVVDGHVHGLFVLVRSAAEPFGHREVQTLGMLAPITGSALKAAETHESAHALVNVDALTSLSNRRKLDADLDAVSRRDDPVAFSMIDVDHFKHFNDTNGHAAGDEALRRVGAIVRANVRQDDVVYRYGGEEFSILLPGATEDEALAVAERVRAAIETAEIPGGENQPAGRVTVSVGVAHRAPGETPTSLTERADAALYRSKSDGRNRVTTA